MPENHMSKLTLKEYVLNTAYLLGIGILLIIPVFALQIIAMFFFKGLAPLETLFIQLRIIFDPVIFAFWLSFLLFISFCICKQSVGGKK